MRSVVWLGDSLERLREFPAVIQGRLGFAIYQAQVGGKDESAKPLRGFDHPVWQVRADDASGTYRAVYIVHFRDAVYVLHTFKKKSVSGIATAQRDLVMIRQRLKLARKLSGAKGE